MTKVLEPSREMRRKKTHAGKKGFEEVWVHLICCRHVYKQRVSPGHWHLGWAQGKKSRPTNELGPDSMIFSPLASKRRCLNCCGMFAAPSRAVTDPPRSEPAHLRVPHFWQVEFLTPAYTSRRWEPHAQQAKGAIRSCRCGV